MLIVYDDFVDLRKVRRKTRLIGEPYGFRKGNIEIFCSYFFIYACVSAMS